MQSIDQSVYVAQGAVIDGDVTIGPDSYVWYNAVIRADINTISIGAGTNIQDNAVVHVAPDHPVTIGNGVTVGHGAIVHGCSVGDNSLVGMGAILLDGVCVGRDCIIGAGALVTQGTQIPDGSVAFGNPAKIRRPASAEEIEANRMNALEYVRLAREQKEHTRD